MIGKLFKTIILVVAIPIVSCMIIFMCLLSVATSPTSSPSLAPVVDMDIVAQLLYNEKPILTQDWHGLAGYEGRDYFLKCDAPLTSPLPGWGVVTFVGHDGYFHKEYDDIGNLIKTWPENSMIIIEGSIGKVTLLHGNYVVSPGDIVLGGMTPIGTEASIGYSTGCHSHVVWKQTPLPINSSRFNTPYATEILAAAHKYEIDPSIFFALIETESGFNDLATSPTGAKGLGQLMPIIVNYCEVTNVYDPQQNLDCSARFLSELITKYYPYTELALAAYNAGEPAVNECQCVPQNGETEIYVERVLDAYKSYKYQ